MNRIPHSNFSTKAFHSIPLRLHLRTDLHLARKIWHMSMGLLIVSLYMAGVDRVTGILLLGSALGLDLFMEMSRLRNPELNQKIMKLWGPLMRSSEVDRFSGIPYYLAASILCIAIFPKPIAILSILYLAFGDPIASVFGILYGERSVRLGSGKSLVGTAAGVLTCSVITLVFMKSMGVSEQLLVPYAVIGGLAGGAAELLPLEIDDNFSIPIVSGFVLWLAFIAMGI